MHSPPFAAPTHGSGGTVNNRPALAASMGATNVRDSSFLSRRGDEDGITCRSARALRGWLTLAAWFAFALPCFAQQTTAPGTQVRNVAQISFEDQFGRPVTVETNPVTAVVEP